MSSLVVSTDGGARGNPGPAGAGAVIERSDGTVLATVSRYLGTSTNNQAEYWAVILALEKVKQLTQEGAVDTPTVQHFLDSQLLARQLVGQYKVKNEGLRPLHRRVLELVAELGGHVTFTHVPRRKNARADQLANQAMDQGRNPSEVTHG